jgi:hypothetical protein
MQLLTRAASVPSLAKNARSARVIAKIVGQMRWFLDPKGEKLYILPK